METLLNTNQNQLNNDDGSFVEFVQTVQNGKAKLAQAIINKGGNVSVNSTFDQMTQAVNNIVTSDARSNFLVQGFYDITSLNSSFYPEGVLIAKKFIHHNAMIGIKQNGDISIYKLENTNNTLVLNPIASVSTGITVTTSILYLQFGYNKSEDKIVFYDSVTSNQNVVSLSMNWSTNELTINWTHHIEETVAGVDPRRSWAFYNYFLGLTISDSGNEVLIFVVENNSGYRLVPCVVIYDPNSQQVAYKTRNTPSPISMDSTRGGLTRSVYYYDSSSGTVEALDPRLCLYYFDIDFSGEYAIISNPRNTHRISESAYVYDGESYSSYPLVIKHIDPTKDYYIQAVCTGFDCKKMIIYLKKYTGDSDIIYDKLEVLSSNKGINPSSSGGSDEIFLKIRATSISYYIEDNDIIFMLGTFLPFKLVDNGVDSPRLEPLFTNKLQMDNNLMFRSFRYSFNNFRLGNILYLEDDKSTCFFTFNFDDDPYVSSPLYFISNGSSIKIINFKSPCVLGDKYIDSTNTEHYIDYDFNINDYNSGKYLLDKDVIELTEGD